MTGVFIRRKIRRHTWWEDNVKNREKEAIHKPKREASGETNLVNSLSLDF